MARFFMQSRNNQSLAVIDSIDDYEQAAFRLKYNNVGTFALTLRRESRIAKTFLDPALSAGLLLYLDPEDGVTPPIQLLSGPQDQYTSSRKEDSSGPLLVSGYSDEYWLQKRLALPSPHYPYVWYTANNDSGPAGAGEVGWFFSNQQVGDPIPEAYYPCNELPGVTTATDYSFTSSNGTYHGGCALGQAPLIDDPNTCVKLDGTSGYIGVNSTANLSSGNTGWSVTGWGMLAANPSATSYLWWFGTQAALEAASLGVTSSGLPQIGISSLSPVNGATAVPLNTPFLLGMTYDGGSTITGYLNGQPFGTISATLNIVYGVAQIGAAVGPTGFWPGYVAHPAFWSGPLRQALHQQMYLLGLSRQSYLSFDTFQQGVYRSPGPKNGPASTVLSYYVQRNASATAAPYATFGKAQPASPFTSVQGARYARAVPALVVPSDPQIGGTTYGSARFDPLLILLQALSLQSSPQIGFKVVQVGTHLQFLVFQPRDMTASAVFSLDRGNLRSYDWVYGRARANYLFTGGLNASTSLQSRTFGEAGDATSIGQFGLIEDFYDYRKTQDTVTLANVMLAKLAELKARRNLSAVVTDTPGLSFMGPGTNGYQLGDLVTVQTEDGQRYTDLVREIAITLEPGKPAVIQPSIGTPLDASILSEYDAIVKRFKDSGISIDGLQNNY